MLRELLQGEVDVEKFVIANFSQVGAGIIPDIDANCKFYQALRIKFPSPSPPLHKCYSRLLSRINCSFSKDSSNEITIVVFLIAQGCFDMSAYVIDV